MDWPQGSFKHSGKHGPLIFSSGSSHRAVVLSAHHYKAPAVPRGLRGMWNCRGCLSPLWDTEPGKEATAHWGILVNPLFPTQATGWVSRWTILLGTFMKRFQSTVPLSPSMPAKVIFASLLLLLPPPPTAADHHLAAPADAKWFTAHSPAPPP